MIKLFYHFFQSILIYIFFFIGRLLGIKLSRKLFALIFLFIGPIFKSQKIINKNLENYSNYAKINKKEIINNMWRNYGMTFIEYIYLGKFLKNNNHVKVRGEEYLNKALEDNKPVIFISGHFANYELMSMEIVKRQIKLATIYRPLNNIFLNPFMEFLRKKYVCPNQIKKGINGVRQTIEYLKKNYSIALMIDQRVSEGDKIIFFGEKALTTTLPAQLSLKFNLNIVPVFIERTNQNNFNIEFLEPIKWNKFKNKIELSETLNRTLEEMIIRNPNQWIWTHNRWK